MIPASLIASTPAALGLLGLDIDGFLTGPEFLTVLANSISTILIALFNLLLLGPAEPVG